MHDDEQWELYGMFAHLLELDGFHIEFEMCAIEAEGEGMEHCFNEGDADMYVWMKLYRKVKTPSMAAREYAYYYVRGNPLTLH